MADCNLNNVRYVPPTNGRYWNRVFVNNPSLTNDFITKTKQTTNYVEDLDLYFGLNEKVLYESEWRWRRFSKGSAHSIEYYSSQQSNITLIFPTGSTINMEGGFTGTSNIYSKIQVKSEDGNYTLATALEPKIIVRRYGYNRSKAETSNNVLLNTRYSHILYFYPDYSFYTSLREIVCNGENIIGYEMIPNSSKSLNNNNVVSVDPYGSINRRPFAMFVVVYEEDVYDRLNNIKSKGRWKSESWGTNAEMPNPPAQLFAYHYPCLSLLNRAYFDDDGSSRSEADFGALQYWR